MAAVVHMVQDLVFVSKIRVAADALGLSVERAADPEAVHAAATGARLVILDLRRADALRALELLAADPVTAAVPTVGFVDHERTDVMDAARARGCGTVLAKGRFASELPALLATPRSA